MSTLPTSTATLPRNAASRDDPEICFGMIVQVYFCLDMYSQTIPIERHVNGTWEFAAIIAAKEAINDQETDFSP